MSEVLRFGVSIDEELLENFDQLVARQGYATRSESLRDLIRDALVRARVEAQDEGVEVLGSLTLVYDHHAHELADQMAELQHRHHELVVSVLHVHISHDDCMEVIVLRGRAGGVRALAESLLSLKGVKHGKLFVTVASPQMTERLAAGRARERRRGQTHATPAAKKSGRGGSAAKAKSA